jgi:hypothetical protein
MRTLLEAALALAPYAATTVPLPCGRSAAGRTLARRVCGVSIFRAGMTMDHALQV